MTINTRSLPLLSYFTSTIETSLDTQQLAAAIQPRYDTRQSTLGRIFMPADLEPIPFEGTMSDEGFILSYNPPSRRQTYRAIRGSFKQLPNGTLIEVRSTTLAMSIISTAIMLAVTVVMIFFFVQDVTSRGERNYLPLALAGFWVVAMVCEVFRQQRMYTESINAFANSIRSAEDAALKRSTSGAMSSH